MDRNYWQERMERNLIFGEKTALEYEQDLLSAYRKAGARIQKEVEAFYGRHAKKEKITYAEARKRLSNSDHLSFIKRQKEYLAEAEKWGNNPQYVSYLRNLSGKAYITMVDEILADIRFHVEKVTSTFESGLPISLMEIYKESFGHTMFEVVKGVGMDISFTPLGKEHLEAAVRERWNGANYSSRIWANRDRLVATLNNLVPQEFVRGRSNQQMATDLANQMSVSYRNAVRLIRTETNYISNKGTMRAYINSGVVKQFEYLATLDFRTSDICREMDGKVFDLKDAQVGINVPPLHPHCRSTTIPFFPSEGMERIARDSSGRNHNIKDMTYKEWAKTRM